MNKKEIQELLNETGLPCVSIILPTQRLATFREADKLRINKAFEEAITQLKKNYSASPLLDKVLGNVEVLRHEIDYTHLSNGLGIYASANLFRIVRYPFSVAEKTVTGEAFDSRELLYMRDNVVDYYLLVISKKYLRLFTCYGEEIEEIKDGAFPMEYKEEFEYAPPSVANSFSSNVLVGYEKDKSFLQEERLKEFLRTADKNLKQYIKNGTPLVISGDNKEIADYEGVTAYTRNIIGKVKGNFVVKQDMVREAWSEMQKYIAKKNELLVSDIAEMVGEDKAITGLENIWAAVQEGKGLKLVIEKDYEQSGYLSKDKTLVVKKPVKTGNYEYMPEVADTLIREVLAKKGSVQFTDNGSMQHFNGVALLLRYS